MKLLVSLAMMLTMRLLLMLVMVVLLRKPLPTRRIMQGWQLLPRWCLRLAMLALRVMRALPVLLVLFLQRP